MRLTRTIITPYRYQKSVSIQDRRSDRWPVAGPCGVEASGRPENPSIIERMGRQMIRSPNDHGRFARMLNAQGRGVSVVVLGGHDKIASHLPA